MAGFAFGLLTISLMLFLGTFHTVIGIKKVRSYPPKIMLKRRAAVMASGGTIFMLLGIFLTTAF